MRVWWGGGGKLSRAVYLAPQPRISNRMDNQHVLLHHLLQKYLAERDVMLTSKVQLGYVLTRGGGQAVQGGLSCPPPRISERMDNPQILLHHLLQERLVERDISFISVNLRCLIKKFRGVVYRYRQVVGGGPSCPGQFICPPPHPPPPSSHPEFQIEWIISNLYYIIYFRNI